MVCIQGGDVLFSEEERKGIESASYFTKTMKAMSSTHPSKAKACRKHGKENGIEVIIEKVLADCCSNTPYVQYCACIDIGSHQRNDDIDIWMASFSCCAENRTYCKNYFFQRVPTTPMTMTMTMTMKMKMKIIAGTTMTKMMMTTMVRRNWSKDESERGDALLTIDYYKVCIITYFVD